MPDARLLVNNRIYSGWKSVRITRSIESIAGSFELEVSDRWAEQTEPWAIAEEDACQVAIGDQVLLDGFVDRRSISLGAQQRTLSYSGRDRAAVLVDCTALLERYTFRQFDVLAFARELCAPFDIEVTAQPGLELERVRKLVINPGDSVFQAIQHVATSAGVLVVSNGTGGIVLTRSGSTRAAALVQGQNIKEGSIEYDGADRYYRYVVATSVSGSDGASSEATRIRAEARDNGVRRTNRVLMIRPEQGMNTERCRIRADWEARLRAARAETVSITVVGWTQPDGTVWPVNALCSVDAPALGVQGTMLTSQAEHSIDSGGGEITRLRLVRPDAFMPEPRAQVRNPSKAATSEQSARVPEPPPPGPRGFSRILAEAWKSAAGKVQSDE